jgi:3,4-dihydroxy-2-butanone 4-phosphate synthase
MTSDSKNVKKYTGVHVPKFGPNLIFEGIISQTCSKECTYKKAGFWIRIDLNRPESGSGISAQSRIHTVTETGSHADPDPQQNF